MGGMLMALLLRLDSVRRVGEYRKKVIRRVISLQEFLDSFPAQPQTLESSEIRDYGADAKDNAVLERHDLGSISDE
ncbi:hypothetical protein OPV22_015535 [Ensete ventricosum]|uniref:BAG domain-containing protein n=1 Tax=Ensete ventricosum TaxID=4639 RepID=A0AAV8R5V5_ENSVE|nr:hypothetical protein OPV22_015535 [Ensete ventricosum]